MVNRDPEMTGVFGVPADSLIIVKQIRRRPSTRRPHLRTRHPDAVLGSPRRDHPNF